MIFILYISRSGSTLLTDRLVSTYNVAFLPENDLVNHLLKYCNSNSIIEDPKNAYIEIIQNDLKFSDLRISNKHFKRLLEHHEGQFLSAFLCSLWKTNFNCSTTNDKVLGFKGNYLFNVLNISYYIPESKFVVITRDVRGVFNSQKNSIIPEKGIPFSKTPHRLGMKWNDANALIELCKKELPTRFLEVQYENLLSYPEQTLKKIGEFHNLQKRGNKVQKIHFFIPERYHKLHEKVNQKVDPINAKKWQNALSLLETQFLNLYCYKGLTQKGYFKVRNLWDKILLLFGYIGYLRWIILPKGKRKANRLISKLLPF